MVNFQRAATGLINVRVHDLRHTFGQRLRATGASLEVRQDLLGHKSGRITTEYCAAQLRELLDVVEKICDLGSRKNPAISVLRIKDRARNRCSSLNVKGNIGGDEWNRTTDLSIMSAAL
jgi:integrase